MTLPYRSPEQIKQGVKDLKEMAKSDNYWAAWVAQQSLNALKEQTT